jgi:DNA-binding transcriptional MerR regulator
MQDIGFAARAQTRRFARLVEKHAEVATGGRLPGIGEISARYGMTARALRFYEARGLIRPIRTGQMRHYTPRDEHRIQMILTAKQLGFSLAEITSMLGPVESSEDVPELRMTCDQVSHQIRHLEEQHRAINQALGELRRRLYLMTEVSESEAGRQAG